MLFTHNGAQTVASSKPILPKFMSINTFIYNLRSMCSVGKKKKKKAKHKFFVQLHFCYVADLIITCYLYIQCEY